MMALEPLIQLAVVLTTGRGPSRGHGPVARPPWLGLHELKASQRAFPRAVVFTTGREMAREVARPPWLGLHELKASQRAFPRAVVFTTGREMAREGEPTWAASWEATA
uniref:Uncharacterized protein n=1 Tax=Solanum tuberosum TaxID=4113 RepID=M1DX23_SOLTU